MTDSSETDSSNNPYRTPQARVNPVRRRRGDESPIGNFAGFWDRFAAVLIDGVITGVIMFSVGYLLVEGFDPLDLDLEEPLLYDVFSYSLQLVFSVMFWAYRGATPGKIALGIKVVGRDGEYLSIGRSILRFAGYFVSTFTLGIGYLWMLWDKDSQTLHDKIAGSYVVRK